MLTEKEKLQRAKMYMLKLADGIDPISNSKMEDSVLNNERLSKCFLYVAQVLEERVENCSETEKPPRRTRSKRDFYITKSQVDNIEYTDEPCPVSQLADNINKAAKENDCKKLQSKQINDWLVENGYLKDITTQAGQKRREITEKSKDIGIVTKQGMGSFGAYTIILYSTQTQKFIVEHYLKNDALND